MIKCILVILAQWCPHCVPLSLNYAQKMVEDLDVPLRVLDIDVPAELKEADRLVEDFGDWSEDYIVPQVFIEYKDGRVIHVFTGFSEGVSVTESQWVVFLASDFYKDILRE